MDTNRKGKREGHNLVTKKSLDIYNAKSKPAPTPAAIAPIHLGPGVTKAPAALEEPVGIPPNLPPPVSAATEVTALLTPVASGMLELVISRMLLEVLLKFVWAREISLLVRS